MNTIIVPAYNEEKGLPIVLTQILKIINDDYEVLVIDDGSKDGTSEAAKKFPVTLIKHEINKGKGEALKTGLAHARGENTILIDSDGSYPADFIPKIAESLGSYDLVFCSRKYGMENIPRFNRLGNYVFRNMIKFIYGFKPYDPFSGLYGAKTKYLKMMNISSPRFSVEAEIAAKAGRMKLKMLDIPIKYQTRVGETKLNPLKDGLTILSAILSLFFWRPGKETYVK
jgi:glycosyltransferase involved in cell wall biosynthesis